MGRFQNVKQYIFTKHDMDYVGICPAALLESEPEGHRPSDLLPTARSIIVFGRHMTNGAVSSAFRHFEERMTMAQSSYADHCVYLSTNFLLLNDAYGIAQYLERTYGGCTMPVTFNSMQNIEPEKFSLPYFIDPYKAGMPLHIPKAAVAAGIGEIGWSHRVVTEKDGPRVNLTALITDIAFEEYDAPYEKHLCDPEKCKMCATVCPTKAIKEYDDSDPDEFFVGNVKCTVCDINPNSCAVASMAMRREFSGRVPAADVVSSYTPTDEEMAEGFAHKSIESGMCLDHWPQFYCDKCLIYCPLGSWKEKFYDTGLSKMTIAEEDEIL